MPVWHTIQSDQIVVTQAGLRVDALVRTIGAKAILDPDAAITAIAEPLARRLPNMPDTAMRTSTARVLPLRHPVDVKLRTTYHAITKARFGSDLPDGATLDIGRDVLEHEALRLDFAAGRIAAQGRIDQTAMARDYTPLRLTLRADGYSVNWGDTPTAFRVSPNGPASVVRPVTDGALTLPVHDDGQGNRSIGWDAFVGKRIVLDLGNRTIWIEKPVSR